MFLKNSRAPTSVERPAGAAAATGCPAHRRELARFPLRPREAPALPQPAGVQCQRRVLLSAAKLSSMEAAGAAVGPESGEERANEGEVNSTGYISKP